MKTSVEDLSPVEKKILVEVEPEQVAKAIDDAYRQLSLRVKIQGFRPGRIPRHILERKFKAEVEGDVAQDLVQRTYIEAVREHKLEVVAQPTVEDDGLKPGEPFRYRARVAVKPVFEPKDYFDLPIARKKHAVNPAEVEAELDKMRKSNGQLVPVLDRDVAVPEDRAVIDFVATVNGQPFDGNTAENLTVAVEEGEFIEGKVAQLQGMKLGTTRDITYVFPKDFRIAAAAGQMAQIKVTLKELKKQEMPALDDEFAKDTGLATSLVELREKVEKALKLSADSSRKNETRTAILKALIANNPFECPAALIDRTAQNMVARGAQRFADQGIDFTKLGMDFDKLLAEVRPKAEEEIRGSLILDAIAAKEKVEPTDAEFQARLQEIADDNELPLQKIQAAFRKSAEKEELMHRIQEEKTLNLLESRGKVTETD